MVVTGYQGREVIKAERQRVTLYLQSTLNAVAHLDTILLLSPGPQPGNGVAHFSGGSSHLNNLI